MLTNETAQIVAELVRLNPGKTQFKSTYVGEVGKTLGFAGGVGYKFATSHPKIKRGLYDLSDTIRLAQGDASPAANTVEPEVENVVTMPTPATAPAPKREVQSFTSDEVYIPEKVSTYVPWGYFGDVRTLIKSRTFCPAFIMGPSGNGKTFMVEQACAREKREMIRVQIAPETDEDSLLGGFRLINGETIFAKGPVYKAMESGAILLLDEIDRGTNKIMCLQDVMEGKPVLHKRTGEYIYPAEGFNVIATANTKGQGSTDGGFTAATILDEAFLERFPMTMEQPYPSATTEKKIVMRHMEKFNKIDEDFASKLIDWSGTIRKTYEEDGIDAVISTRRLCHITQTYSIFGDRVKAIDYCTRRFDEEIREAFVDLYEKVDRGSGQEDPQADPNAPENVPF